MSEKSSLSLFIDQVGDMFSRENFLKIRKYTTQEPFLSGSWKFFDVSPNKEDKFFKVKHGFPFIPKDFLVLSKYIGYGGNIQLTPDKMGYFYPYADDTYIYLAVIAPTITFAPAEVNQNGYFFTQAGRPISVALHPFPPIDFTYFPKANELFAREGDAVLFLDAPYGGLVSLPPGLSFNTTYYIKYDPTAPATPGCPYYFQLSATPGGASINSPGGVGPTFGADTSFRCVVKDFRANIRFIAGAINDL